MPTAIVLRPWRAEDAVSLVTIYSSSPDLERQFSAPVRTARDAQVQIAERFVVDDEHVNAAVVVGEEPVGNVAITSIRRSGPHSGTGWVSYFGSAHSRGQGLIGRACAALCTWALTEHRLERLELGYRVNNPASAGVARRAGFVVEGLERKKLVYDGVRFDVEVCSRLWSDPTLDVEAVRIDLR